MNQKQLKQVLLKKESLKMWQWLKETGKGKKDYKAYLKSLGKEEQFYYCHACLASNMNCADCVVQWPTKNRANNCCNEGSPFVTWDKTKNKKQRRKYAAEIYNLIKDTWRV